MIARSRPVARLADIAPGTMKAVEVDGAPILLVRHHDRVTAVDGRCPHAGGPLGDGVLHGDQVICPWHKAAFSVRSGACQEPPAVDDLRSIPLEIREGSIFLAPSDGAVPPRQASAWDKRCFVVIGGGAAGFAAAQALRGEGFRGRVVLIDREGELPYDRTILSKYVLSETKAGEKSPLQDEAFYHRLAIERRRATVTALHADSRTITFADGSNVHYDAALIATGGSPATPPFPGAGLAGVFTLRNRSDAAQILAAARTARHVVVVGASFIGMEVAASLRERGLDVTVVAKQSRPFEKQLGARIGAVFQTMHEGKGVLFRMQRKVARLDGDGAVQRVLLTNGESIAADLVVVGLGIRPATSFLKDVEVPDDGGIPVDGSLRVADRLFAAGDVAAFPLRGDGPCIRLEHWRVAEQHGRLAARNMLGEAERYEATPYFWTIQYMQRLDYVGQADGSDPLVVRGSLGDGNGKPDFIAYYLRDGKVAAGAGLGRDRDMAAVLALMGRRDDWTVDELHPPDSSPAQVLQQQRWPVQL